VIVSLAHKLFFFFSIMKIALLIVVGILFWTSDDARNFTADQLNNASEIVRPDVEKKVFSISF